MERKVFSKILWFLTLSAIALMVYATDPCEDHPMLSTMYTANDSTRFSLYDDDATLPWWQTSSCNMPFVYSSSERLVELLVASLKYQQVSSGVCIGAIDPFNDIFGSVNNNNGAKKRKKRSIEMEDDLEESSTESKIRKRRQSSPTLVTSSTTDKCYGRNSGTGDGQTVHICPFCELTTTISGGWFPSDFKEIACNADYCFANEGLCSQQYVTISLKRDDGNGGYEMQDYEMKYGCEPYLYSDSVLVALN